MSRPTIVLSACRLGLTAILAAACELPGPGEDLGMAPQPDHASLQPLTLTEVAEISSESWALPDYVYRVGDFLFLSDSGVDSLLHIVDVRRMRVVGSFGRRGEGPGEFRSVFGAYSHDHSGEIWIYDVSLRRFTILEGIDEVLSERWSPRIMAIELGYMVYNPVPLSDARIAMLNFGTDGRVLVISEEGEALDFLGFLPPAVPGTPANVAQHAYQASMVRHPTSNSLAIGSRHAGRIEILDEDGAVLLAEVPFSFAPRFEVRQGEVGPVMSSGDDLRFGYIDLVASGSHIIGLFSGRLRGAFPGVANFGEFLHVFGWDGSLEAVARLSRPALGLEVDGAGRLVAIVDDPVPSLVFYEIGEVVQPTARRSK